MRPICPKCSRFYIPTKNGYYFTEGMPLGNRTLPGLAQPDMWVPYKVWVGDLYECPDCKAQVIVGVPRERIAEHYESDFVDVQRRLGADQLQVNDCC